MVTEKIKLLNISKNEHRSEYVFPREQKLIGIIRKILKKLNFEEKFEDEIEMFGRPMDQGGENFWKNEENIESKDYNERGEDFYNKDYNLDIIFFSNRVLLIFNYKEDKQQEISEAFEELIIEED